MSGTTGLKPKKYRNFGKRTEKNRFRVFSTRAKKTTFQKSMFLEQKLKLLLSKVLDNFKPYFQLASHHFESKVCLSFCSKSCTADGPFHAKMVLF